MSLCHPMAEPDSERWLWQLSIHFELLPLEMVHRVVIQAADRNVELIGFQLNLNLITRGAGENTAADRAELNHIFIAAR